MTFETIFAGMDAMDGLQVLASLLGLSGAFLVRKPGRWMPWGFVAWLVSNPAAMLFMALSGHWLFFLQHAAFTALAFDGVRNWLVLPAQAREVGR